MSYLAYTNDKKIPIPLAIGLIVGLIVFLSSITSNRKNTVHTKAVEEQVEFLEIANKTPHSANIVVCLRKKNSLTLNLGTKPDQFDTVIYDDRDTQKTSQQRRCHYFSLSKLIPETSYYMSFSLQNNALASSKIIHLITPTKLNYVTNDPLFGKIVMSTGKPMQNGILIARFNSMPTISTRVTNGEWLLPLHYLEKIPSQTTPFKIEILDGEGAQMEIDGVYRYIDQLKKTLIFGKFYSFKTQENTSTVVSPVTSQPREEFLIIYPKSNTVIPSFRPLFKGLALPENKVTSTLELLKSASRKTGPIVETFNITTNKDGVWTAIPTSDLAPSRYRLTVSTTNKNGQVEKIARIFHIQKSGEAVLGEATNSATLTPTPQPSPTPTQAPLPTIEPTQIITIAPSLPQTGVGNATLSFASVALIAIGITLLMVFK